MPLFVTLPILLLILLKLSRQDTSRLGIQPTVVAVAVVAALILVLEEAVRGTQLHPLDWNSAICCRGVSDHKAK